MGLAIIIFLITYAFLASEKAPRHFVVLCGSAALWLTQVMTAQEAAHYVDWNTILLLAGMFAGVELLEYLGFFEWVTRFILRRWKSHTLGLFFALPLLAGVLSMGLNNITVMIFMARLTLKICRYVALEPVPLIIGEVCMANMLGAATLIGSPPNLVMAAPLGYGFSYVSSNMAPLACVGAFVFICVHFVQHRGELSQSSRNTSAELASPTRAKFHFDYETLLFFIGLFILVGALDHVGVFMRLAQTLSSVRNPLLLMASLLWVCAVASALIDNIPMALAMAYLIKQMALVSPGQPTGILVWAALTGLSFGGNMTPIGASPNVVAYGILEKNGTKVGWLKWVTLTAPATFCSLVAAHALIWLKYRTGWY